MTVHFHQPACIFEIFFVSPLFSCFFFKQNLTLSMPADHNWKPTIIHLPHASVSEPLKVTLTTFLVCFITGCHASWLQHVAQCRPVYNQLFCFNEVFLKGLSEPLTASQRSPAHIAKLKRGPIFKATLSWSLHRQTTARSASVSSKHTKHSGKKKKKKEEHKAQVQFCLFLVSVMHHVGIICLVFPVSVVKQKNPALKSCKSTTIHCT